MSRERVTILIFLTVILSSPVWPQSYSSRQTELAERLHSLALNAPPELAYIQTNKDIYETGEDLWFKVYLLDAQYLIPSLLSRTLYLQLMNEYTRKVVWEEKYEIQNGFANGRVYIESSLPEGEYLLAAYTPNSFYDDTTEFKAVRKIIVRQDITKETIPSVQPVTGVANTIQFTTFPEGGDLVSGIQDKLAFKAVNRSGEPVEIKGTLFEENKPLLEFKSKHAGMGSLYFIPVEGKKYHIRLSEPAVDSIFYLPEIVSAGMAMQLVDRDDESLTFKVSRSPGLIPDDIYMRVQCRGIVYGMTTATLKGELRIKLPLAGLPQGIAEVTLFNSHLLPVAERLVYINKTRKLNITSELSRKIYATRGKATLKIKVTDDNGWPVTANLGVTVFDKLYQNPHDSNNILSHYYLSTQLKGRIYNPSYYFNSKNKDRDEALDLLMLSQGWRKYVWNESNLKKFTEPRQQIIFNGIKGELYYPNRRKKIPDEQTFVIAYSPNKDSTNALITADSFGAFTVSEDRLKAWSDDFVYLKPFGPHENKQLPKTYDPLAQPEFNLHIKLPDPFITITHLLKNDEIVYPLPGSLFEKEDNTDLIDPRTGVIRIKDVTIKGQGKYFLRGKYLGTLDSLEDLKADEDYVCRFGILNCQNHPRNDIGSSRPRQGGEYLVVYNYNTPGAYTRRIVYWRPKYTEAELLKLNNLTKVKAYYGKREFYKPDYDINNGEAIMPDFRNTLVWEPAVITDEKGEATLSFFCSDINTDFVGRIEGVGGEGLLGTGDFKFTVRKMTLNP